MKSFLGKNVLITGGASGIGRLMALDLLDEGVTVIIWDINKENMKKIQAEAKEKKGKVFIYECDVSDKNEIFTKAKSIKKEAGKIDILINNAGVVSGKPFMECTDEQIEKTFAINTMALFWTTRAFLPDMIEKDEGHIVNISSASGLIGVAGLADYAASKFAAFGFDESIRVELKKRKSKVKTTIVCPYYINTGMFNGVKTRFSWLLPILNEKKVAKKIIKTVKKGKGRLLMPWAVYTVMPLRIFSTGIFDFVASLLGIHNSMDEFKGRKHQ